MDRTEKRGIAPTIGIGVTTTPNRAEYLELWLKQFHKHAPISYHLHIHCDDEYRGVAYSKNQNIHALKGCRSIYLFDDDCFPIRDNWEHFFYSSGHEHVLYLNESHRPMMHDSLVTMYADCGGVFIYLTKEVVERVGYINPEYGQYGFEHAAYSHRIAREFGEKWPYKCLNETESFLHSIDYDGPFEGIGGKSSVPDYKKPKLIEQNREVFIKELKSQQIYYAYTV